LIGLAFLPSSDLGYTRAALCGFGLGLSVPGLTHAVLGGEGGIGRKATLTVGVRHVGLVVALAVGAPLLAGDLVAAADVAKLNATAVIIDGQIPATTKIPLALDIRDELDRAPRGDIPDFSARSGRSVRDCVPCDRCATTWSDDRTPSPGASDRRSCSARCSRRSRSCRSSCSGGGGLNRRIAVGVLVALFIGAPGLIALEFAHGAADAGRLAIRTRMRASPAFPARARRDPAAHHARRPRRRRV
jgi:hypothetical protein